MTEKQLIEKLNKLSTIAPRQEWVALTKKSILGADFVKDNSRVTIQARFSGFVNSITNLNYKTKLAYSFSVLLLAVIGTVGMAQSAVPGDTLFSVRRATEKIQTAFNFNNDASKYNFEIANKRLEDLTLVVKDNRTQNLAPAISEFQASIADATKNLLAYTQKNPKNIKDIANQVKKIKDSAVLLDKIGGSDLGATSDNLYKAIVEEEIKALDNVTLTEEQKKILVEIKELFDAGNYSDAFEKILIISN